MHACCLVHFVTHTKVHHTCWLPLPTPHPPIPTVIIIDDNELSWERLRDKEFRNPQVQEGGLTQLTNHLVRPGNAAAPSSLPRLYLKARHCPNPHNCWSMQGVSDLLDMPEMLEMMPLMVVQQVWGKELSL